MSPSASLPAHFPSWVSTVATSYLDGSTSVFVLHGNVYDLFPNAKGNEFGAALELIAEGLFGRWDLVIEYDLADALQVRAGGKGDRHREMVQMLSDLLGPKSVWPRGPDEVLSVIDQVIDRLLMADESDQPRDMALLLPFAQFLLPPAGWESITTREAARLVHLLKWAEDPLIRRLNIAVILLTESLTSVHPRLIASSQVATVEVPLPDEALRRRLVTQRLPERSENEIDLITDLTNGLTLGSIDRVLTRQETGEPFEIDALSALKRDLIERECGGLLEFLKPNRSLDLVVGHEAAKKRLRDDMQLLNRGHLETLPMGYLICGPVGTGKSFLAECFAGSVGIPCVALKNFRSKYVGETEANLERVLTVLRALGPVLVVIDEADAALGNRETGGDSGVSSRVFSMIASQMGNTQYRGQILWMLLTARPERLPIDLKRQGRAEVHIPLFYPRAEGEVREMFVVMGRKNGIAIEGEALPESLPVGEWSGADIESIVITAQRQALLADRSGPAAEDLQQAIETFLPSIQAAEKRRQEVAAVLECTDARFLPPDYRELVAAPNGRERLRLEVLPR